MSDTVSNAINLLGSAHALFLAWYTRQVNVQDRPRCNLTSLLKLDQLCLEQGKALHFTVDFYGLNGRFGNSVTLVRLAELEGNGRLLTRRILTQILDNRCIGNYSSRTYQHERVIILVVYSLVCHLSKSRKPATKLHYLN